MQSIKLNRRAFTLIELLIVITIIGILAAALLPRITSGPSRARDAQRKADLQQITTAIVLHSNDNSGLYYDFKACTTAGGFKNNIGPYMTSIPSDPQGLAAGACATGYRYEVLDGLGSFILLAGMENPSNDEGYYEASTFSTSPQATTSFSEQIVNNASSLCSDVSSDCDTNGTIYVVGI